MSVVLCGFMGCGKSTVGKIIAGRLGMSFVDTDSLIEKRENRAIKDIFAEDGEAYFRDKEHEICCELSDSDGYIIAVGGGALTFDRNAAAFKSKAKIIFIDVDFGTIVKRVGNDKGRPLMNDNAKELYDKRLPLYNANCDCKISVCGDVSADEVADQIIKYYINGDK